MFWLYVAASLAIAYFVLESYPFPFVAAAVVTLLLLSLAERRAMQDLRRQLPKTPPLPPDASATRIAALGAFAMCFGGMFPVVVLSLATDFSFFGASLHVGDYAGWFLRLAVMAAVIGTLAFLVLRSAIAKSFRERRRLQADDH